MRSQTMRRYAELATDRGWTRATVRKVLTNKKYICNNIYNRVSCKGRHMIVYTDAYEIPTTQSAPFKGGDEAILRMDLIRNSIRIQ